MRRRRRGRGAACHGMSCFVMRAGGTPLRCVMRCHVLHVVGAYAVAVSGINRACPPSRRGMHTSPPGRVALHVRQPSPRPPSRGPASVLAAAPDRGPGQAPTVRPVLRRLRRHRGSWMDPGSGATAVRFSHRANLNGRPPGVSGARGVCDPPLAREARTPLFVIPGLVPGIHTAAWRSRLREIPGTSPGMTGTGLGRRASIRVPIPPNPSKPG